MKNAIKALILIVGIYAARSEAAGSYYFKIFGSSCYSTTAGVPAIPTRFGIYNASTSKAMEVICPVQAPDAKFTYGYIGISAYNRNANDALSCTLNFSSPDGYGWQTAVATISNTSPSVQYASRYVYPTGDNTNVWINCHIPASVSGNNSYLSRMNFTLSY